MRAESDTVASLLKTAPKEILNGGAHACQRITAARLWEVQHIPEMNYRLVKTGGEGGINGGIMKPQQGPWPGKLTLYIDVDDLDAYGDRIKEAGGKLLVDKMEVPGVGQLSLFEDPDGRMLGLWKQMK